MITVNGKPFRHGWPGKIGRKVRKFVFNGTSKCKGSKYKFTCVGGPFDGVSVRLYSGGTLPFSVKGFKGYYSYTNESNTYPHDKFMEWMDL